MSFRPAPAGDLIKLWTPLQETWSAYAFTVLAYYRELRWQLQALVACGLFDARPLAGSVRVDSPDVWIWKGARRKVVSHAASGVSRELVRAVTRGRRVCG